MELLITVGHAHRIDTVVDVKLYANSPRRVPGYRSRGWCIAATAPIS